MFEFNIYDEIPIIGIAREKFEPKPYELIGILKITECKITNMIENIETFPYETYTNTEYYAGSFICNEINSAYNDLKDRFDSKKNELENDNIKQCIMNEFCSLGDTIRNLENVINDIWVGKTCNDAFTLSNPDDEKSGKNDTASSNSTSSDTKCFIGREVMDKAVASMIERYGIIKHKKDAKSNSEDREVSMEDYINDLSRPFNFKLTFSKLPICKYAVIISYDENEWNYDKTISIITESVTMVDNIYNRLYYRYVNGLLTTWEFFAVYDVYHRLQKSVSKITEITSRMLSERNNVVSFNFKIKVKGFEEEMSKIVGVMVKINDILFEINIDSHKIEALK